MLDRLSSQFLPVMTAVFLGGRSERGQMGTEIALIGVVCATCVLGAVVVTMGDEASRQLEDVFHTGLQRAGGTLVVQGSVVATASGNPMRVDEIRLTIGTVGDPGPIILDSSATGTRLLVSYHDDSSFDPDVPYTAIELAGDNDGLLEAGETAQVRIKTSEISEGSVKIGASAGWTLQLSSPSSSILEVSRTMPLSLDRVNALR